MPIRSGHPSCCRGTRPRTADQPNDFSPFRARCLRARFLCPFDAYDVNASPQHLEPFAAPPGSLLEALRDSNLLYNHVITNTKETAKKRFDALEPGQNFHDLPDNFKASYTDAKRTQNTIYLRLKYDEPSGTVVNVRKSMWEHPIINRALSIREAARLQTFPDSFRFTGTKDAQYQQVGNAVPPILARAIAEKVLHILHGVQDG